MTLKLGGAENEAILLYSCHIQWWSQEARNQKLYSYQTSKLI